MRIEMHLEDNLEGLRQDRAKPSEEDLRRLPCKKAFIYGRVSTPGQVEDSRESIREIAFLVGLAARDGYHTRLTTPEVEVWLQAIQEGPARSRLLEDGDIIVDCQDLGLSGTLREDKRPGLAHLTRLLEEGEVGAVYLNPATGRPYNNAPGTISMRLYRPFASDQLFFGSLDDVARRVSYLPLEQSNAGISPENRGKDAACQTIQPVNNSAAVGSHHC